ncbi:hypothetical protein NIES4101_51150 [Calothrix sp. NIES-4101]|nr:hypothetical protein NIES4101_51150 [Calothrix sp. NIES-4101]
MYGVQIYAYMQILKLVSCTSTVLRKKQLLTLPKSLSVQKL